MRQKKSNWIYYVVGVLLLTAIGFVVMHEVPMPQEHVEEEISLSTR